MTTLNSVAAGGSLPSPTQPSPSQPKPTLTRPEPLPQPSQKPAIQDRSLTPMRSQQLANTQAILLDSIRKGIQNGSITQQEAAKLLDQQAKVATATALATEDGVVTAQEAANILLQQARAGLDVFLASNNRDHSTPSDPAITKEQAAQLGRIAEGVRNGSLTGAEANTLLTDQSDIARTVADAQADGEMDFIEQQVVRIRQDAASYEIGQEKSDTEKAPHATRLNFPVLF